VLVEVALKGASCRDVSYPLTGRYLNHRRADTPYYGTAREIAEVMRSLPGFNARAAVTVYALAAHSRTPGFADELVEQVNAPTFKVLAMHSSCGVF
jgi:hypothetical protein